MNGEALESLRFIFLFMLMVWFFVVLVVVTGFLFGWLEGKIR